MNDNKNNNDKNNDDTNISMIAKNVNIYEELKKVCITSDALSNRYFILNYYQTIPLYYLLCNNKNINSCIYNFSVGSGKTAASLFVILYQGLTVFVRSLAFNPFSSRYFRSPSRSGVWGLKPKSRSSGSVSAKVTGTSPGCMGTSSLWASKS